MEHEDTNVENRNERMRHKYKLGQKGNGSAAYNPVNMEYESSPQGQKMKLLEQSRSQRAIIRGQMINQSAHPPYNPVNGHLRAGTQAVPNGLPINLSSLQS